MRLLHFYRVRGEKQREMGRRDGEMGEGVKGEGRWVIGEGEMGDGAKGVVFN